MSSQSQPSESGQIPERRRINRSCLVCTRRKVKCDGAQPCCNCVRHQVSHLCNYRQRTKRHVVSKSSHQLLEGQLQMYADFVDRLFPGIKIEHLSAKDSFELAQIASITASSPAQLPPRHQKSADSVTPAGQASEPSPGSAEEEPAEDREWHESSAWTPRVYASDDNNAISLATDPFRRASFLGVTSNSAVLRAIFRLNPAVRSYVATRASSWSARTTHTAGEQPPASPTPASGLSAPAPNVPHAALDQVRERRCIKFYFEHLHAITPILIEEQFWENVDSGRQDLPWLGLLHMVLTMGSIASGSPDLHEFYYRKAQSYLNFETLGMGSIESLQALSLLGGYYLHFRNSPNMAFAILGACHRVAIALGLHREPRRAAAAAASSPQDTPAQLIRAEYRRRTWWTLFCFDTWMSVTLGRPTCGRWDPSTMDTQIPSPLDAEDHAGEAIRANCAFCLICNRIQHRFAQIHSHVTTQEVMAFDAELEAWYENLPQMLKPSPETPHRLSLSVETTRQRYVNARLVMLRSVLIRIALRGGRDPLSADELAVLETSTAVTAEAIDAIALHWVPNRLHVWTCAWHMFQACMAPLLYITISRFMMPLPPEHMAVWERCVAKALDIFVEMRPWMRTTDRTPDTAKALFEAVTQDKETGPNTNNPPPAGPPRMEDFNFAGWLDDPLDLGMESDWGFAYLGGSVPNTNNVFYPNV